MNILKRISFFYSNHYIHKCYIIFVITHLNKTFNATTRFIIATLSLGSVNLLMVHLIDLKKEKISAYLKSFFVLTAISTVIYTLLILIFLLLYISTNDQSNKPIFGNIKF